ncbi:hypothetical protein CspeluHIS016_0407730 [Cutaneotrichosporon spelunceum]|uniref:CENP-V/GFA domain-containing protein n=1 Tax=Cutaneotrichosporon spelunceum TaxID=1672016 RepID=A0AAD3YDI2_9TREE|nr:hypothetical protein CspeluHIS016_0407730 [Cutaneotrichosporon spelunceum]
MVRTGGCYCQAIRYELEDDSAHDFSVCYCEGCKYASSSHSMNLRTDTDKIKVTKGTPKVFLDTKTLSGKPMKRKFCGDCGNSLWSEPSAAPGKAFVKVGTLDDKSGLKLLVEVFCSNALRPYEPMPKGTTPQLTFAAGSAPFEA